MSRGECMNKKGFTLVELLAIVILLAAVFALIVPRITELLEKESDEIDDITLDIIYNAADRYLEEYLNKNQIESREIGTTYCFKLKTLDEENLIPVDISKFINKRVKIKIGKSKNYVKLIDKCDDEQIEIDINEQGLPKEIDATIKFNKTSYCCTGEDCEKENKKITSSCISGSNCSNEEIYEYTNLGKECYNVRYLYLNGNFANGNSLQSSMLKVNCSSDEIKIGGYCHKKDSTASDEDYTCPENYTLNIETKKCMLNN